MTPPHELVSELEEIARELTNAAVDLDRVEALLTRRASVVTGIAASDPHAFTPGDLAVLRAATLDGEAIMENLVLLRRRTAIEWMSLNRLRMPIDPPQDTLVSLEG